MRNELYGDDKDVWKWSVAIRCAKERNQSIYWAVLLRPNAGEHGMEREFVPDALPGVPEFFEQERSLILMGYPRSLSRTTILCEDQGVKLFSKMDAYPASTSKREEYVESLVHAISIRGEKQKYLVFLDPDNGIGESDSNGMQIHKSHLSMVWESLEEGDTLGIVQFKHHVRDGDTPNSWPEVLRKDIAARLQVDPARVIPHRWSIICIYLIDR